MKKILATTASLVAFAFMAMLIASPEALAQQHLAQGSWFGRAVPIGPCTSGSPGCPLPPELFMVLNISQDGNFIGHDSLTFPAQHTTAHGQWYPANRTQIQANYVVLGAASSQALLTPNPDGSQPVVSPFVGAYRMRWLANVVDVNNMEGFVNVYFFPFVNEFSGLSTVDPDTWAPIPDPLNFLGPIMTDQTVSQCKPSDYCLGVFQFKIRRVNVP